MSTEFADELTQVANRLREVARQGEAADIGDPLRTVIAAAVEVGRAWSGSPLGYHSRVYYADFAPPPPGANFSSEWGFMEAFSNYTEGDWREYTHEAVVDAIFSRAGVHDLEAIDAPSNDARDALRHAKAEIRSLLSAFMTERPDELLADLKSQAENITAATREQLARATLPTGQLMSRDMRAMSGGLIVAPHYAVHAQALGLRAPFESCGDLAKIASQAAGHITRLASAKRAAAASQGRAVFIGHGGSLQWRTLKDFLQDRLGLTWEEFNRVPVAGVTNTARLAEMLDAAGIAFLVLTAEDEKADGSLVARQNVVHEAGLFQGRLGFTRAIVLLEDRCDEFSNIQGLGQIRFPAGRIDAAFEDVRRVLEREGYVTT